MKDNALAYVTQDIPAYADMIVPIQRGTATVLCADEAGVLLLESGIYMLAAKTDDVALCMLDLLQSPTLMCIRNPVTAKEVERRFGLRVFMTCQQAVWQNPEPPPMPETTFTIQQLPADMASAVNDIYSHDIGLDYIQGRLSAGEIWGAFDTSAKLAGFIGLHEEGSMGMLEVLPDYRRQGLGRLLLSYLCGKQLMKGIIPISQFTTTNEASRRLHTSMGFCFSTKLVYWLM